MRKTLRAAAMAALTLITGATVQMAAAGAAQAGPAGPADYRDCPDRYLCLWGDGNYEGRYLFQPEGNLFVPNIGSFMNDLTTSIWNRTGRTVCFYNHINYQGQLLCIGAGGSTPNVGAGANDKISSFQPF
jgi:Peptidase inhibitor family I36